MRPALLAGVALAAVTVLPREAEAGDFQLQPALAVSEEYNDNVYGTADGRKTDFITRVQPGMKVHYLGRSLSLDSAYIFDYRNYARGAHEDEEIHNGDVKGSVQFIENFLILDFGDALHRTTVNVSRDVATENLLVNQTMQNIAFASPYLLWRIKEKGTVKTGYRYTDTRYFEGAGLDKQEHTGFTDVVYQVSDKLSLSAGYAFTSADTDLSDYRRHDLSAGFRYDFTPTSQIFGSVGNSWNRFSGGTSTSTSTSDLFWDAGIRHDFGWAVARLQTRVQNVDDPQNVSTRHISYLVLLERALQRGGITVGANYNEYYIRETGKLEYRRGTINASGRYELMPKLIASCSVYGERFSRDSEDEYPYRLTAGSALTYGFYNDHAKILLGYTLVLDRLHIDSSAGERLTNRVLVEARTSF